MNKYLVIVLLVLLSACKSKQIDVVGQMGKASSLAFEQVDFAQIPGWQADTLKPAFKAFLKSIPKIKNKPDWQYVCATALNVNADREYEVRRFFENNFQAFALIDKNQNKTGIITGYYEPLLHGSRTKTALYKYPIYTKPKDLVSVNLSKIYPDLKHLRLCGRLSNNKLVPYYTRSEIDSTDNPLKGNEIFWVESRINLYFLHVQGSGRIQLNTGEIIKVGYNGQNGYPYTSIGKLLVTLGELPAEEISMQSIKKWFASHPQRFEEICYANDRYNFFMEMHNDFSGPIGSLNVPLTPGRSVAVDRKHIELGTPVFLSTQYPDTNKPFRHLVMAQDTGAAIVGRIRADLFWGFGATAQHRAGMMKENGEMWVLLPNGVLPENGNL